MVLAAACKSSAADVFGEVRHHNPYLEPAFQRRWPPTIPAGLGTDSKPAAVQLLVPVLCFQSTHKA